MPTTKKGAVSGKPRKEQAGKKKPVTPRRKKEPTAEAPLSVPEVVDSVIHVSVIKADGARQESLVEEIDAVEEVQRVATSRIAEVKTKVMDMKAKDTRTPQSPSGADPSFLAPDSMSFDLKKSKHPKQESDAHPLVRALLYVVTIILALAVALLFAVAFRVTHEYMSESQNDINTLPTQGATTLGAAAAAPAFQLATFNVPAPLNDAITANMTKDLPAVGIDMSATSSIPADAVSGLTVDTLLLKTNAQPESSAVLGELSKLGLQPKLVVNDSISDDFALYLTSKPAVVDLSMYTSTVLNGSGVSGAAKKYCGYLTAYKVISCVPTNSTAKLTGGLQVHYKSARVMALLSRTPEFRTAVFTVAASTQAEDVQVVLGK